MSLNALWDIRCRDIKSASLEIRPCTIKNLGVLHKPQGYWCIGGKPKSEIFIRVSTEISKYSRTSTRSFTGICSREKELGALLTSRLDHTIGSTNVQVASPLSSNLSLLTLASRRRLNTPALSRHSSQRSALGFAIDVLPAKKMKKGHTLFQSQKTR